MKYYRVKKEYDQTPKNNRADILIEDELYSKQACAKLLENNRHITLDMFDIIDIPVNKTFWSFGARFAMTE